MTNQGKNAIDLVLAESLKELAATRPIDKITIKEITDRAGVVRPTFYNHFQDKYELLEWIVENELIGPARPLLDNGMMREGIAFMVTTMERERDFYVQAAKLEGQNSFPEILKKNVTQLVVDYVDEEKLKSAAPFSWLTPERISDYYAQSLCYVAVSWARGGMTASAAELTEIYLMLLEKPLASLLREIN